MIRGLMQGPEELVRLLMMMIIYIYTYYIILYIIYIYVCICHAALLIRAPCYKYSLRHPKAFLGSYSSYFQECSSMHTKHQNLF